MKNILSAMIALLTSEAEKMNDIFKRKNGIFNRPHSSTPASGRNHRGSNNHGQKESKARRKMAKQSRKINRRRK